MDVFILQRYFHWKNEIPPLNVKRFAYFVSQLTLFARYCQSMNQNKNKRKTRKIKSFFLSLQSLHLISVKIFATFFFLIFCRTDEARPFYFSSIYMGYDNINDIQILHFLRLYALNIHNP